MTIIIMINILTSWAQVAKGQQRQVLVLRIQFDKRQTEVFPCIVYCHHILLPPKLVKILQSFKIDKLTKARLLYKRFPQVVHYQECIRIPRSCFQRYMDSTSCGCFLLIRQPLITTCVGPVIGSFE